MCLGIPMQVLQALEGRAECAGRHGRGWIDTTLLGEVRAGEWLLTWLGAARGRLEAGEAARIELALDALAAAQSGQGAFDVARFFPDLVDREPELPEHLRPVAAAARQES
ncbi:MAG: HypC/HybG/HupF family hydrogenase formation chaperone [Steroidobacteraceae bacterium]|jgi:hydrogenase expression/formation protein HypC|nr:HypC/HybG/HupF family hydrogenase formation chaperone [Steroidobacteraceae bacterium]